MRDPGALRFCRTGDLAAAHQKPPRGEAERRHDVIYIPPGVEHAFSNTGTTPLVFIVATSPVTDA